MLSGANEREANVELHFVPPIRDHMSDKDDFWYIDDLEHVDNASVNDDDVDDISGDDKSLMQGVQPAYEPVQEYIAIDLTDDDDNPFISAYIQNIKHAKDVITGQWK
jgi:hypothetical protein